MFTFNKTLSPKKHTELVQQKFKLEPYELKFFRLKR